MRDNTTKSSNGMDWEINKRARFVRMDSIRPQAQVWRDAPAVNPKGDVLSQGERVCPHNVDAAIASYRLTLSDQELSAMEGSSEEQTDLMIAGAGIRTVAFYPMPTRQGEDRQRIQRQKSCIA